MPVSLKGSTSGSVTVQAAAVAGVNTITLPANTGTVITTASSGALPVSALSTTGTPSASTYLDGTGAWATISSSGQLIRAPQIITSGTSYTTPSNCTKIYVEAVGGGGGSGGYSYNAGSGNTGRSASGGGGGGGLCAQYFTVTGNTAYTYAIGAGGTAGSAGNTGGTGGTTTFTVSGTTISAGGGVGSSGTGNGDNGAGGAAGIGTGATLNSRGGKGAPGVANGANGGVGGLTFFGQSYGGGGNGTGQDGGQTASGVGLVGAAGMIRIWEYT